MTRVALAAVSVALAGAARAVPPPVVGWQEAASRVGDVLTVEGDVADARTAGDTVTLEFAPGDPGALRVVLLIPMFTDLPRHPERLYAGRRVRATGLIQRFHGRPEIVLRNADSIEVIDVAARLATASAPAPAPPSAPSSPPAATSAPAPPAPRAAHVPELAPSAPPPPAPRATAEVAPPAPPVAVAPVPAPAATAPPPVASAPPAPEAAPEPEEPPSPKGLAEAVQRRLAQLDACERARARWREAGADASARAAVLDRCLSGATYGCRSEAAALAPALTAVEWAAQQVEANCP